MIQENVLKETYVENGAGRNLIRMLVFLFFSLTKSELGSGFNFGVGDFMKV